MEEQSVKKQNSQDVLKEKNRRGNIINQIEKLGQTDMGVDKLSRQELKNESILYSNQKYKLKPQGDTIKI